MNHQHKFNMDYIIFWSSLFAVLVLSHKTNGIILTESNDLHCTHIQCPTKCPEDSYLKSTMDMEEDEFIDFEDEFISNFEELTPLVESHEEHPEHTVKERQKREVFFQDDIESCCGDQKCVCHECLDVPKCFQGYVAVRIHEGKGEPGNCCSQYRCLKKEECQIGVKQTWWTGKCTNCSCFGETEFCEQICREEEVVQNCYSEYLQKPLINGAVWKEGPCTKCTCEQGERRCFASICPKLNCKHTVTYEDVCCPKCVDDETDERIEIAHNQEMEEEGEEAYTETIEFSINDELNSTEVLENTSTDIIILSDNFTSTPLVESVETNTSASSQELTSTSPNSLESNIDEKVLGTTSSTETSTETSTSTLASSPVEEDVSLKYEHTSSTILSSTSSDELHSELDSTTKSLLGFNEDVTTSTTSITTEQPKPEKELTEETTTAISSTTQVTASTAITAMPSSSDPNEETTTQISLETSSSTEVDLSTVSIISSNVPTTTTSNITPLENASTGISSSTIAALESTSASSYSPSTTTDNISFSQMSSTLSSDTTETPVDPTTIDTSSSFATTTTTSTTSSPYSSALETSSVNPVKQLIEESSTISTTSAPEPLMPLYQLYGEFNSDERISSTSTQNQMRILFNEIDYVVMIGLFVGSLMCIAVGLVIRHAKNRKKLYSSVPNSETSLSQTSTVMTV